MWYNSQKHKYFDKMKHLPDYKRKCNNMVNYDNKIKSIKKGDRNGVYS